MKSVVPVLITAALCVFGFLAWRANTHQQEIIRQQQQQIDTLRTALDDKSKQDMLALQEKCANQAEKMFRQLGFKFSSNSLGSDTLQSHFNTRLNRCFMTVESTAYQNGQMSTNRFLLDAYEQREYGSYFWVSDSVKKYWEVQPVSCKEMPLSADEHVCHSDDEYKAIVKRYME